MCLELFHMSSWWELIALNRPWCLFPVISSTEKDSTSWRKGELGTIVVGELPMVFSAVKFNFLKDTLTCGANKSHCIDSVVDTDSNGGVTNSLNSCLLWTGRVHESFPAIFHSDPVCDDNSIDSTSHHYIVLFAPGEGLDLSRMTWESHSLRVLSSIELKYM